jgi:hypothetical protein
VTTLLKQSTAVDIAMGPFLDETDGKTAETALTITQPDIRLKKNGGAWAQKNAAQTLSHEEAGWYEVALDTTDTNTLGILVVAIHESGALPVWREFMVVPANVYDSLVGGSDNLQVDAVQIEGSDATDQLDAHDGAPLDAAGVRSAVGLGSANLDTQLAALPTAAENADAVWDEAIAGHAAAGSTGEALAAAGSAGDPWATALPGSYSAGQAGKIVGDNLNATVGSRATQASVDTVDDLLDTEVAAIKAKTDNLPAAPAATGDIPTAGAIADAVWDEGLSGHLGAGSTGEALDAAASASLVGAGAISWDVLVQEGVTPVQGAAVWVATDAAGSNVVAGTLITPSDGTVTFLLDAGDYYAFVRKDGLNPVVAQAFTVS